MTSHLSFLLHAPILPLQHAARSKPHFYPTATLKPVQVPTTDGASLLTLTTPSLHRKNATAVLLHDFMTDHRLFSLLNPHLQSLSPNTDIISYDIRGFGHSSIPTAPYSHFDDLTAVANTSAPVHLVAVGMSGPIALEYAIAYPTAVHSIVCVGSGLPGHRWPVERMLDISVAREQGLLAKLMGKLGSEAGKELVQWKQRFISGNETWAYVLREGDTEVTKILLGMAKEYGGFHFFNYEEAEPDHFGEVPLIERLGMVECPVLALVGERDTRDFKEIAAEISVGVKRGTGVAEVEGAGHFAVLERACETAEEIVRFWESLESDGVVVPDGKEALEQEEEGGG